MLVIYLHCSCSHVVLSCGSLALLQLLAAATTTTASTIASGTDHASAAAGPVAATTTIDTSHGALRTPGGPKKGLIGNSPGRGGGLPLIPPL